MRGGLSGEVEQYLTYDNGGGRLVSSAEDQTLRQIAEISGGTFVRGEGHERSGGHQTLREILIQEVAYRSPATSHAENPVCEDFSHRYFLLACAVRLPGCRHFSMTAVGIEHS